MSDLMPLYGIPCGKCSQPAAYYTFETGYTRHLDTRLRDCFTFQGGADGQVNPRPVRVVPQTSNRGGAQP